MISILSSCPPIGSAFWKAQKNTLRGGRQRGRIGSGFLTVTERPPCLRYRLEDDRGGHLVGEGHPCVDVGGVPLRVAARRGHQLRVRGGGRNVPRVLNLYKYYVHIYIYIYMKTHPVAGSVLLFSRACRESGTRAIQWQTSGNAEAQGREAQGRTNGTQRCSRRDSVPRISILPRRSILPGPLSRSNHSCDSTGLGGRERKS